MHTRNVVLNQKDIKILRIPIKDREMLTDYSISSAKSSEEQSSSMERSYSLSKSGTINQRTNLRGV